MVDRRCIIYSGNTISIGEYYCNANGYGVVVKATDLATAKNKCGATPIAVIFSTNTSATDKGHGWTNGYAMALKEAGGSCKWSSSQVDEVLENWGTGTNWANWNKDGYTECQRIRNNARLSGGFSQVNYPAFYQAMNYNVSHPQSTSNWYLLNNGQALDLVVNLGKAKTSGANTNVKMALMWENTEILNNINTYFNISNSDLFIESYSYWLSSEASSGDGGYFTIRTNSSTIMQGANANGHNKIEMHHVRPVIAF